MKIRPPHDRILVKRLADQRKASGGIRIPDAEARPLEETVMVARSAKAQRTDRAYSISTALVAGAILLSVTLPARGASTEAREALSVILAPGASLELNGDSSLHRYSAKAYGMEMGFGIDAARVAPTAQSLDLEALIRGQFITTFQVTVSVDKLTSGERGLDTNMRKALKASQYKEIRFRMDSYDVLAPSVGGGALTVVLHGRLSLAGVERRIDVDAAGARVRDGIRFTGSKDLLMTDYQIKPPTVMFGTIKTANLVTVKFNATLRRK